MKQQRKRRNKKRRNSRLRRTLCLLVFVLVLVWVCFAACSRKDTSAEESSGEAVEASLAEFTEAASQAEKNTSANSSVSSSADASDTDSTDAWNLILVNPDTPLPDTFSVQLTTLEDGYQVDARIADAVQEMYAQAKADGITLMTCSAYRSKEKQATNYNNALQQYLNAGDTQEEAERKTNAYYTKPGYSEHHTGLALDIVTPEYSSLDDGYADTQAAKWLKENAYRYGFILRYPEDKTSITKIAFEPWHYRYVGVEHAEAIQERGICLEEYCNSISQ